MPSTRFGVVVRWMTDGEVFSRLRTKEPSGVVDVSGEELVRGLAALPCRGIRGIPIWVVGLRILACEEALGRNEYEAVAAVLVELSDNPALDAVALTSQSADACRHFDWLSRAPAKLKHRPALDVTFEVGVAEQHHLRAWIGTPLDGGQDVLDPALEISARGEVPIEDLVGRVEQLAATLSRPLLPFDKAAVDDLLKREVVTADRQKDDVVAAVDRADLGREATIRTKADSLQLLP